MVPLLLLLLRSLLYRCCCFDRSHHIGLLMLLERERSAEGGFNVAEGRDI